MHLKIVSDKDPDIFSQYYQHLLSGDKGASADAYMGDVQRFMQYISKNNILAVQSISALDLVEYRSHLLEEQLSPAAINRSLHAIKSFFKFAHASGLISSNPARDIKLIKTANPPAPKWLTRSEQAALIRAVKETENLRDETVVILLLHAGLRVSELAKLRVNEIVISPRGGLVRVFGKGNKYREVPLNSTARKILTRWIDEKPESIYLFPGQENHLTSRAVRNIIYKYAYLARLKDVSPHTLRHTFCKNLLDRGVPLTEVSAMAGHTALDTTKIYTTPSIKDLQDSVERTAWE